MSELRAGSERGDHVRRLQRRRSTGGAGAERRLLVDAHQHRFTLHVRERDVQIVREAALRIPVEKGLFDVREDPVLKLVAELRQSRTLLRHNLGADLGRLAETHDERDGKRPRSHPTDRKSTRLNSSHLGISYAVFCLKKKKKQ